MPSWSGLFDGVHNAPYAPLNEQAAHERRIARTLAPMGVLATGALGVALTGAAVGGTAAKTFGQVAAVQADGPNLGGARTISTATAVNRATVAGDETRIDSMLQPVFAPTSYPVDASGNGGGGKRETL